MLKQLQLHEDELHTDEHYSGIVLNVNVCNCYDFRSYFYSFL